MPTLRRRPAVCGPLTARDLLVGCVAENDARHLDRALRLARSIRWFGGELAAARLLVCVVGGIDAAARQVLESLGAEIRVVPEFDRRNRFANKLRFFEAADGLGCEALLLLDCDMAVVRDPLPLLARGVLQMKIAPVPSVTPEVFARLFRHFGLKLPPPHYENAFTRTQTVLYCNSGMVSMPAELARRFVPVWCDFNARLAERLDLLGPCAKHCNQASLSLALAACEIPFEAAPDALNYQLNIAHLEPPEGFLAVDPAILHYHDRVDAAGLLLPAPYPLAQARIEQLNRRLRQEWAAGGTLTLETAPPSQLFVLGMHRSGTSAITRLLHLMGCHGGPGERFAVPDQANPKGYWENGELVLLDDDVLEALGASWCDVAGLDLWSLNEESREMFLERARELLRSLDAAGLWVAKDPRLCLLFPLWREVLERPACVLIYREPLPVALSLAARHGLPLHVGIALWELYTRAALAGTLGLPRALVSYHDLVAEPMAALARLLVDLTRAGVEGLHLPEEAAVRAFLDPALERQARDPELQRGHLVLPQLDLLAALEDGSALALDPVPPLSPAARAVLEGHRLSPEESRQLRARARGLTRDGAAQRASLEQMSRWNADLDALIAAVFASRSWKLGHGAMRLLRALVPSRQPTAPERWRRLQAEMRPPPPDR